MIKHLIVSRRENLKMPRKPGTREELPEAREAKYGGKMIEVKIRFWTDGIAEAGKIIPKHA